MEIIFPHLLTSFIFFGPNSLSLLAALFLFRARFLQQSPMAQRVSDPLQALVPVEMTLPHISIDRKIRLALVLLALLVSSPVPLPSSPTSIAQSIGTMVDMDE
jgi:hypothetical protein